MALRDIKNKITSIKKTAKVTKAMESVSAVKMRKAQEEALAGRKYAFHAFGILKHVAQISNRDIDDFFDHREIKSTLVVLITSDKGLAGALNSSLFKRLEEEMANCNYTTENVKFVCVGRKGQQYVSHRGYEIVHYVENSSDNKEDEVTAEIAEFASGSFNKGECDGVFVAYTNFRSTTEQYPVVRSLLPVRYKAVKSFVRDITPSHGKYSELKGDIDIDTPIDQYTFEPNKDDAIKSLMPFLLNVAVFYGLLEARASEHSARMVAMKNATDKAGEVAHKLNRKYNKARQAAITNEISEIVGGMEAVS